MLLTAHETSIHQFKNKTVPLRLDWNLGLQSIFKFWNRVIYVFSALMNINFYIYSHVLKSYLFSLIYDESSATILQLLILLYTIIHYTIILWIKLFRSHNCFVATIYFSYLLSHCTLQVVATISVAPVLVELLWRASVFTCHNVNLCTLLKVSEQSAFFAQYCIINKYKYRM